MGATHYTTTDMGLDDLDPYTQGIGEFEDFYRREYNTLVGISIAMTGSRDDGEDVVQEAMVPRSCIGGASGTSDGPPPGVSTLCPTSVETTGVGGGANADTWTASVGTNRYGPARRPRHSTSGERSGASPNGGEW